MSYCDVNLVRTISGLDSNDIRESRIRDIRDDVATARLNDDIQTTVDEERVRKISTAKKNNIDGENKTFYLRELHNSSRSLGDLNNNGDVGAEDISVWMLFDNERQNLNVEELADADEGKFILEESVPKGAKLFVRYKHAPVNVAEPNKMVEIACAQLTGAFCFSNIETSKLKNFSIGDVTIRKQSDGFAIMHDQYTETLRRIVNRELIQFEDNENSIEDVIKRDMAGDRPLGQGKNTHGRFRSG